MNAPKVEIKRWMDRIDEFSLRERAMIFLVVIGLLYAIASMLIFEPLRKEQARLEQAISQKHEQTRNFDRQIGAILARNADVDQQRIDALEARLNVLDASLFGMTKGFVSPKDMAQLVEQMLLKNRAVTLVQMESLAAAPLFERGDTATRGGGRIFKHGMRVTVRGRYPDLVNYLQALEKLPWKVFWGEVGLRVEALPYSRLTFVIYTLSLDEAWIGA